MMSGQFRANLRLAFRTVRQSKGRSLLTLTGIVIGVAAFIVVVAIGQGIKHQVSGQISQLGKNVITIRAGRIDVSGPLRLSGSLTSSGSLEKSDIDVVRKTAGVQAAVPLSLIADQPVYNGNKYEGGPVIATSESLPRLIKRQVAYGTFFDGEDSVNAATIGTNTAKKLFGSAVPLGKSFELLGQRFVVTGVFQQFDTAPFSLSSNFNNAIFIRYQTALQLTRQHTPLYEILVKPDGDISSDKLVANLNKSLEKTHGQHDFTVLTQKESLGVTNNILSLITRLVVGVAAIALLVGGVGIMDIMLVSVAERMSEIGLRKAVGGNNRQILDQFVVEALVLSALGATIGSLLGLAVFYGLIVFSDLSPILTWQSFVIADLVAIAVGVIFGTIPALKAAKKDPIDALRMIN